jgi:ABC-type Fe3+ transport system permease subunit
MTFSIKKSFKDSWSIFTSKKFYLPFILVSFVAIIGLYIVFGASGFLSTVLLLRGLWWVMIPLLALFLFLGVYFILVNINLSLVAYKTKEVHFKKSFSSVWNFKLIAKTTGLLLLVGGGALIVGYLLSLGLSKIHPILGISAFIIWVAYVAVRLAFSVYILVDSKETIINSMKKSHAMMKGNGWKFLLFIICVSIISAVVQIITNRIGFISPILSEMIVIIFGIAFAPWFSLLTVSPYLQLKSH